MLITFLCIVQNHHFYFILCQYLFLQYNKRKFPSIPLVVKNICVFLFGICKAKQATEMNINPRTAITGIHLDTALCFFHTRYEAKTLTSSFRKFSPLVEFCFFNLKILEELRFKLKNMQCRQHILVQKHLATLLNVILSHNLPN